MTGELASEDRAVAAHGGLDEGVAHAVAHGLATALGDDFLDHPRGAQVIDHGRAGLGLEELAREQCGHQVGRHGLPGLVHEAAAVRVGVEAHTQVGADLLHQFAHGVQVLFLEGVGLMVREGAVGLQEDAVRGDAGQLG